MQGITAGLLPPAHRGKKAHPVAVVQGGVFRRVHAVYEDEFDGVCRNPQPFNDPGNAFSPGELHPAGFLRCPRRQKACERCVEVDFDFHCIDPEICLFLEETVA